jgi:hypothetical protein
VIIKTRSGARYLTDGATVTRMSEQPIQGYAGVLDGTPLVAMEPPTVGVAWRYQTAVGWFITTRVVEVVDRPMVHMARRALVGSITVEV